MISMRAMKVHENEKKEGNKNFPAEIKLIETSSMDHTTHIQSNFSHSLYMLPTWLQHNEV
ncbi:CLUMA_CG014661, isoform A [Clunio marinus]|uniref:CLUMA_CG014661, isoform A n=1 Tax=Clunio marinus TaxID=568069 RepID=A0A1J1IPX1_9DIPT|nr:CLUMA_CG014661, isoform A [Clunio marinus]